MSKKRYHEEVCTQKKYKYFNIFTRYGENRVNVEAPRLMTLDEAMDYFNALAISGYE